MLFVWISIPFVCKGSGTCGTQVMKNFFGAVSLNFHIKINIIKIDITPKTLLVFPPSFIGYMSIIDPLAHISMPVEPGI